MKKFVEIFLRNLNFKIKKFRVLKNPSKIEILLFNILFLYLLIIHSLLKINDQFVIQISSFG